MIYADTSAVVRAYLSDHPLRTLDALHLAVALDEGERLPEDEQLRFVTRDMGQAIAAEDAGLACS